MQLDFLRSQPLYIKTGQRLLLLGLALGTAATLVSCGGNKSASAPSPAAPMEQKSSASPSPTIATDSTIKSASSPAPSTKPANKPGPIITTDSVEAEISKQFEQKTQSKLDSITCPQKIESAVGNSYDCKAKYQGDEITIIVKPTDDKGGFSWNAAVKTLPKQNVENEVKAGIEKQTSAKVASIDCPKEMENKVGETFECAVKLQNGQSATVLIKPTGEGSQYRWEAKR